jgi:hypothetical protein
MQGIYNYVPETNHVSNAYNVAAILCLQHVIRVMSFPMTNLHLLIIIIVITISSVDWAQTPTDLQPCFENHRLVIVLSTRKPRFDPRHVRVGFAVDKVELWKVSLRVLRLTLSISLHQCWFLHPWPTLYRLTNVQRHLKKKFSLHVFLFHARYLFNSVATPRHVIRYKWQDAHCN